jgi:thiamine pyrophosphate-dependent acetolactate synthase large subunit-like protein
MLRRAVMVAATPPYGPVYLCLPADVMDAVTTEPVRPTLIPDTRVSPDEGVVEAIADRLAAAENPIILVGDGVAFSGAQGEVARLAELVGAPVFDVDSGELNLDQTHPAYSGSTGHMFGAHSLPLLRSGDAVLVAGTYLVPEVFPELGDVFDPGAYVAHVDLDAGAIAKNHRVDVGVVADPKRALAAIADRLATTLDSTRRRRASERLAALGERAATERSAAIAADRARAGQVPLPFAAFMEALAARLPEETIVFDEALTNSPAVTRYRPSSAPGSYLLTRGGSLGVGIPGAIGAKLACPDRPVVSVSGDGGSMYTFQALWTAARHGVNAVFVVANNRSYRLLQANISAWWDEQGLAGHDFPTAFDLSEPRIRFDDLASSLGVVGIQVEKPEQIAPAVNDALSATGPVLVEVVTEGDTHPELVGVHCGQ